MCTDRNTVQRVTTSLAQPDKQLAMAFWRLTHHMAWLLIIQAHIIQAHSVRADTSAHMLPTHGPFGAAPGLMCNWHDWLSPWQPECWPWQVPREQLVGSGRLVSRQIYSQSSTACPLNRGRNYKEAIRVKGNKDGIVERLPGRRRNFSPVDPQLAGGVECDWGACSVKAND